MIIYTGSPYLQMEIDNMSQETKWILDCACEHEVMMEGAMCETCGFTTCLDCSHMIDTTDANPQNWKCRDGCE